MTMTQSQLTNLATQLEAELGDLDNLVIISTHTAARVERSLVIVYCRIESDNANIEAATIARRYQDTHNILVDLRVRP